MKIGIFGGTFNPVHKAHLETCNYVKKKYSLEKILLVPSSIPVHKTLDGNVNQKHRVNMLKLAIRQYENFELCLDEVNRDEKSYSYITAENIKKMYPNADLYFILGTDSFNTLDKWEKPDRLIDIVSFIVMQRPGDLLNKKLAKCVGKVYLSDNKMIDISSSSIRSSIEESFKSGYIDSEVYKYIKDNGLYGIN